MFILEVFTGTLLILHYVPTSGGAYQSVQDIAHVVPYGFLVRNLHYWCGQVMVGLVVLHMVRVFLTGSYASPRRMNWIIGVLLLVSTVLVDFSGYLLVWDARSLLAWTVARNLLETIPTVGGGDGCPALRAGGGRRPSDSEALRVAYLPDPFAHDTLDDLAFLADSKGRRDLRTSLDFTARVSERRMRVYCFEK